MKFFQYYDKGEIRLGYFAAEGAADAADSVKKNGAALPVTMDALLNAVDSEAVFHAYEALEPVYLDGEPDLAPVVSSPDKIICIGLNYQSHIDETGLAREKKFPPVFPKYPNSLTGDKKPVKLPVKGEQFDYEAELVIVIGKEAYNVAEEQAKDCIFGYTAGNDFSARDLQFATGQWLLGKACDDFAPTGPVIVTADSIDPDHLDIACRVNGTLCQKSNTGNMIFTCAEIVSYLSQFMTLKPGDLIFSGTPDGVILGKKKGEQVWLKSGDVMEVMIEGIGTLTNICK